MKIILLYLPNHATAASAVITSLLGQRAVLGPGHVVRQPRGHVLPRRLEVAGPAPRTRPRLNLAPRPEGAGRVLRARALARRARGLPVVGAHDGVVAEVGGVVLETLALRRLPEVARGTFCRRWRRRTWLRV